MNRKKLRVLNAVALFCNVANACWMVYRGLWFIGGINIGLAIAIVCTAVREEKSYRELQKMKEKYGYAREE